VEPLKEEDVAGPTLSTRAKCPRSGWGRDGAFLLGIGPPLMGLQLDRRTRKPTSKQEATHRGRWWSPNFQVAPSSRWSREAHFQRLATRMETIFNRTLPSREGSR
jgi:hypothetical protein